ncbi:ribosome small subunit-dependent GTPase A [Limisphaera sp. VF-2]|uniref:ribosome small subunit-dependent GTPase A n=1 Tax=Limisphaera sp. VF-2 TaxID=3400418 RepID=UPI00256A5B79|nr:ribosome small subunit-dependent GTPase A [Limisphaera sp.]
MADREISLATLGWDPEWEQSFAPHRAAGLVPARVVTQEKHRYLVCADTGVQEAQVLGRWLRRAQSDAELPKVGDWVACRVPGGAGQPAIIEAVLPRRTRLARKVPGRETEEQVLVTNVDTAFVVQALDQTFNPRLLERMLLMCLEGGVQPVVVLNKADLCTDPAAAVAEARRRAGEAAVILTSARSGEGIDQLRPWVTPGKTGVFMGPSGVGKSSLINQLYGEEIQPTAEVRERDHKGRHTTTWRELIVLPGGGLVIDTPGMREFHLWMAGEGLHEAFPDIELVALRCRFRDCRHESEPGCAVREAVAAGQIDPDRLASYKKLRQELEYLHRLRHWQRPPHRRPRSPRPRSEEE